MKEERRASQALQERVAKLKGEDGDVVVSEDMDQKDGDGVEEQPPASPKPLFYASLNGCRVPWGRT